MQRLNTKSQVDTSNFVVQDQAKAEQLGFIPPPEERLRNVEISDDVDDLLEEEIRMDLNLPEARVDMKSYDEFLKSGERLIRAYLINQIDDEQKRVIRQGILKGKYELEDVS